MAVNVRIKTPPDLTKQGVIHSTYQASTVYTSPVPLHNSQPAQGPQTAVAFSYVRNNRVVGFFPTAADAKLAMDFHISRETEFGSDI